MREFAVDLLQVNIFETRAEMGIAAARATADALRKAIAVRGEANIMFASSPSQSDLYLALSRENVDWSKVNAFHMDEYAGVGIDDDASFAGYVRKYLFSCLPPLKNIFFMNGKAEDLDAECARYARLLLEHPLDITCAGIGENGHMAFNDPYIADLFEPNQMKINACLDPECRVQQVRDGWFPDLEHVPEKALTVTLPGLMRAPRMVVTVPGATKTEIVRRCLDEPICLDVPASALRLHRGAELYIDEVAAAALKKR